MSICTFNTEYKVITIAKQLLSTLMFPLGIYRLLHSFVGKFLLLPASTPALLGRVSNHADISRSKIHLDGDLKYKRFTVEVDGYKIDAVIVGKASSLTNGRWMLVSNGNSQLYEDLLSGDSDVKRILSAINGNALLFNYPGVGASSGLPNRYAMSKAYQTMLTLLEDKIDGIGAKEIIGYGHSIGGGVQGDALETHKLKSDVRYVFIKGRTFSTLSTVVSTRKNPFLGLVVKILGWNMSSIDSSKKLQVSEIILQTTDDRSVAIHDGVIPAEATLAKALLECNECPKENKVFIALQEKHSEKLRDIPFIGETIESLLAR